MARRGWEILGVTTAAFFVTMFARLAPSPLVPDLIDAFPVTKSGVGIALTGMWAAYALFQFPGGIAVDRVGERRVVLLAMGATGVASLSLAAAPSFLAFAAVAVLLGAGAGLYFTAGTAFLTAQFDNTGRALGVHEVGASSAGLVAPVASVYVAERYDWRAALVVPAAVALVVLVLFAWRTSRPTVVDSGRSPSSSEVAPSSSEGAQPSSERSQSKGGNSPSDSGQSPANGGQSPPDAERSSNDEQSLGDQVDVRRLLALLSRPGVLLTTVLAMVAFFTWQAFASFFPTFLVEYAALSEGRAGLVFGVIFAITIGTAPALGWASDRVGRDVALVGSFLAGVAGYALFLLVDGTVALVGGTGLVALGLSWPGVVNSRFMDHLAVDERGTGFGLVRTVVLLVSSLGSGVTGTLADLAGWRAAYGLVAGLLAALVVVLAASHTFGIDA